MMLGVIPLTAFSEIHIKGKKQKEQTISCSLDLVPTQILPLMRSQAHNPDPVFLDPDHDQYPGSFLKHSLFTIEISIDSQE